MQQNVGRSMTTIEKSLPRGKVFCPDCKGTRVHDDGSPCWDCDGQGVVTAPEPDRSEWQYRHERAERDDYSEHGTYRLAGGKP